MKRITSRQAVMLILLILIRIDSTDAQDTYIIINKDIKLTQICDSFFVHTSWYEYRDFGIVSSNGLLYIKNGEAILIDTPNDNEQTRQLLDYLKDTMNVYVRKVIIGHSHNDCLGGLEYINSQGIESISGTLTRDICEKERLPVPSRTFNKTLTIDFNGEKVFCYYPGEGHTIDNIVVYFPECRVLYGGCLVKSINSRRLGYTGGADPEEWKISIEKVQKKFPDINYVIPGHGEYGNSKLLTHTLELLKMNDR